MLEELIDSMLILYILPLFLHVAYFNWLVLIKLCYLILGLNWLNGEWLHNSENFELHCTIVLCVFSKIRIFIKDLWCWIPLLDVSSFYLNTIMKLLCVPLSTWVSVGDGGYLSNTDIYSNAVHHFHNPSAILAYIIILFSFSLGRFCFFSKIWIWHSPEMLHSRNVNFPKSSLIVGSLP